MLKNAKWITSPTDTGVAACDFKTEISLTSKIKRASLTVTSVGNYAAYINGKRVGKGVLTPGFTSYKNRVVYQTYDVADMLTENSEICIGVGQGWAVGCIGYGRTNHFFSDKIHLIASLDIEYENGKKKTVVTDKKWKVYTSAVTFTDIYHGETQDLTAPITLLGNAKEEEYKTKLVKQDGEWICERERLRPVELIKTPNGETVIDFGQNMTGYVEIKVKGERGGKIVIHHAEVLDKDGNFYTANLRSARNENTYILSGGEDVFKPIYTFQGFRYIQLVEYPFENVDLSSFTAVAVYSDMKRIGDFKCGNEKINQLYHNIIWGQRSNFLDVPTDCPQRDERLGWTGDAQVFCRTASINYDTKKFYTKWLADVALEQTDDGAVYGIVPHCLGNGGKTRISAAWGDVACIMPWELYTAYGDKALLKKHFPMMKKWVNYLHSAGPAEYLWLGGFHYGDWLAMDAGEDSYVGATSNDLIASAFFAYSTSLVIKAGEVLGEDVSQYRELYGNVVRAFREYFMENGLPKEEFPLTESTPNKHAVVDSVRRGITQTAIVLILHFGLYEKGEDGALIEKLCELIRDFDGRMTTGFVGTPYILHVLSEFGKSDVAYSLLMQERNPSWLYSVTHGATTMWEHWNSLKEDGSFWSTAMNSFNHYAYGAVYDWIFGVSLGIKPTEPGYKAVSIAPHPSKALGFAEASIETKHGRIRSYWYYKGDVVYYEFDVPADVTATVTLPSGYTETVSGGTFHFAE